MYYTTMDMIADMYDRYGRQYAFDAKDTASFEGWRKCVKDRLLEILGFGKFVRTEAEAAVIRTEKYDGFEKREMYGRPKLDKYFCESSE